jgi:hypothetical protein
VPWQTNLPESASLNVIRLNKFTHLLLQRTLKNKLRIRRGIMSSSDRFQIISALIRIFSIYDTNKKFKTPRRIFIWFDELESLIYYSSSQFKPFTQGIRTLIDKTPQMLSVFLNFSFSEPSDIKNIEYVIGGALLDRVTNKIIFEEGSLTESKAYIGDLFTHFRKKGFKSEKYFPFTSDIIDKILEIAPKQTGIPLTPRAINKWFLYILKEARAKNYFDGRIKLIDQELIQNLDFNNALE